MAVRNKLGLAARDLAADLGLTPDIVEAWENGTVRVPSRIARELRWREALLDRKKALERYDLRECEWVIAWQRERAPDGAKARAAHLERVIEHQKSCHNCLMREAYATEWFGEMPARPTAWWMSALTWMAARVERWPRWAQPAAWFGLSFGMYSLLRLAFMMRSIMAQPRLILSALAGLTVSVSIGVAVGLAYGGVRTLRTRRRPRAAQV